MGFRKYQKTEDVEVVSPNGHRAVERELKKQGKASARSLSTEGRKAVSDAARK